MGYIIHMEIEKWGDKFDVSDGEDIDYSADTLAEAYLYLAKILRERGDSLFATAMRELQYRINNLPDEDEDESEVYHGA